MTEVYVTERGRDRLTDLEEEVQTRIKKKLEEIRDWPEHFLKPLTGRDDHVLRVGEYRVLIDWDKDDEALYVKSVGHRRNFYDREV